MVVLKLCCVIILAATPGCARQEGRTLQMPNPNPTPLSEWSLPIDPTSPSSMVSATHLLRVRLEALQSRESASAPNQGKSRELILRVRLEEVFKGRLVEALGTVATVTVHQTGLDPIGEGPPPTLDPEKLAIDHSYLLDAVRPGAASLADLFTEKSLRGVYPANYALDASLAHSMEQRFAPTAPDDPAVMEHLLAAAETRKSELHGLFGAYLWLRLAPRMEADREGTMSRLLRLALGAETRPSFALTLLAEFDTLALDLEDEPEELSKLAQAYAAALGRELPAAVKHYIATQNLYNIAFDEDGQPVQSASDFGIPSATAGQATRAIGTMTGEKAMTLLQWLR